MEMERINTLSMSERYMFNNENLLPADITFVLLTKEFHIRL